MRPEDPLYKNRYDTKYIIPGPRLSEVLERLDGCYRIFRYEGRSFQVYESLYFDDPQLAFYRDHRRGRLGRQKVRMRLYSESGFACLEIKMKTNRKATRKWRRPISRDQYEAGILTAADREFVAGALPGPPPETLAPQVSVRFTRLTLQSRARDERVTLDWDLAYIDVASHTVRPAGDFVVAEVKQASRAARSPFRSLMRELRIPQARFSKYCYGVYLARPQERHNRLKPVYRELERRIRPTPPL
jgi:hypothetical protein